MDKYSKWSLFALIFFIFSWGTIRPFIGDKPTLTEYITVYTPAVLALMVHAVLALYQIAQRKSVYNILIDMDALIRAYNESKRKEEQASEDEE